VIGSTNPVWLDADGDGQFTAPRALAKKLLVESKNDLAKLLALLAKHDRAVAAQSASLCHAAAIDLNADASQALLKAAPESVRAAFMEYLATTQPTKQ
jgi:hypothetical protein